MFDQKRPMSSGITIGGWLSLAFLSVSFVWVGYAYAAQLNSANRVFNSPRFGSFAVLPNDSASLAPDGTILSQRFVGELLKSSDSSRGKLLWGMYPASIRGRVFSGASEINTPFDSFGAGGW